MDALGQAKRTLGVLDSDIPHYVSGFLSEFANDQVLDTFWEVWHVTGMWHAKQGFLEMKEGNLLNAVSIVDINTVHNL